MYDKEYHRRYRKKNRERIRENAKRHYHKNRRKIIEKTKLWQKEHPKYMRKVRQDRKRRILELRTKLFGDSCKVCNTTNTRMILHEIHGKKHEECINSFKKLKSLNIDDFVLLCVTCHLIIHFCSERTIDFENLRKLIQKLRG